jgi:RNA polymerase sigma factor (sigma-70 family)
MAAAAGLAPHASRLTGRVNRLRAESVLIRRFREGDEEAFAELYRRHFQRVYAVCLGVLGSQHDAQDAAQEVFTRAASALRRDPPLELRAWLVSVARNKSIDLLRARRAVAEASEAAADSEHDPVVAVSRKARLEELMSALKGLPENQRSALVLRELGGFSYGEIATSLALDEQAVNGLIARARLSLRGREESLAFDCDTIRRDLSRELDGRRRPAEARRHLRNCSDCRDFHRALRGDRRAIRALGPAPGLGLVKLLLGLKATRYAAVGSGLTVKSLLGGNAAKLAAACVLCLGVFEGARELELAPLGPDGPSSTGKQTGGGSALQDGTATPAAKLSAPAGVPQASTGAQPSGQSDASAERTAAFEPSGASSGGTLRPLAPEGARPLEGRPRRRTRNEAQRRGGGPEATRPPRERTRPQQIAEQPLPERQPPPEGEQQPPHRAGAGEEPLPADGPAPPPDDAR